MDHSCVWIPFGAILDPVITNLSRRFNIPPLNSTSVWEVPVCCFAAGLSRKRSSSPGVQDRKEYACSGTFSPFIPHFINLQVPNISLQNGTSLITRTDTYRVCFSNILGTFHSNQTKLTIPQLLSYQDTGCSMPLTIVVPSIECTTVVYLYWFSEPPLKSPFISVHHISLVPQCYWNEIHYFFLIMVQKKFWARWKKFFFTSWF